MKKFLFFLCCLFIYGKQLIKAQNFSIEAANIVQQNPYKVKIELAGNKIIKEEDIQLTYSGQPLTFSFESLNDLHSTSKAYCILVENTGFTHIEPIKNFKNAIVQFLNLLNPEDKVALCTFSEASIDKGSSLKILSNGFTEDKTTIKNLTNKIISKADTNAKADIYKSVYEALDWMSEQKDLPQQKYLVLLTAGINFSYSAIKREDCENKSNKLKIPIYAIVHKTWTAYSGDNFQLLADNTQGKYKFVDKATIITDFLSTALNLDTEKSVLSYKYELTFEPPKVEAGLNPFMLKIQEESLQGEFMVEKKSDTKMETILFIAAGLGVVLIGIGLLMKRKKVEEKTLPPVTKLSQSSIGGSSNASSTPKISEIKSVNETNLANTIVNSPISNSEIHKTAIASSNIPTLKIVSISGTQHYRIEKLPITIGREPSNDLVIADNSVSKKHAQLYFDKGYFILEDLDSTNGIVVNGQKIAKVQLKENEKVYLGNATLELYLA